MSRADIFVFVEGWTDRYFYDKVCHFVCCDTGVLYQVRTSEELNAQSTGKSSVLDLFTYLRKNKLLFHQFKGKKLAALFFLDKDVDDFLRVQKRSQHLIYTKYYSLENHLLKHIDLANVTAAAVGLEPDSVRAAMGDQEGWMYRAATRWKNWVKLCLLARTLGANCQSNYRRPSQVNAGCYGEADDARAELMAREIHAASGLAIDKFEAARRKAVRIVENTYARRQHDLVFKGKWYIGFLIEVAQQAAAGRAYNANGLEANHIFSIANASVDVASPWAEGFVKPLEKVLALFRCLDPTSASLA